MITTNKRLFTSFTNSIEEKIHTTFIDINKFRMVLKTEKPSVANLTYDSIVERDEFAAAIEIKSPLLSAFLDDLPLLLPFFAPRTFARVAV
ncbi:hypothetical protein ACHAWX_003850 [Stephanocyclus meneghinianus]